MAYLKDTTVNGNLIVTGTINSKEPLRILVRDGDDLSTATTFRIASVTPNTGIKVLKIWDY